jgi:hypothetical protein
VHLDELAFGAQASRHLALGTERRDERRDADQPGIDHQPGHFGHATDVLDPVLVGEPEIALGRKSWLFAGSELAGKRAAMVMSLVPSAKLHGHDPWVCLKDMLERLLAHPNNLIDELLPHRGKPVGRSLRRRRPPSSRRSA